MTELEACALITEFETEMDYQMELSQPDPDAAYERWLEDRGYEEARAQEAFEARVGIL